MADFALDAAAAGGISLDGITRGWTGPSFKEMPLKQKIRYALIATGLIGLVGGVAASCPHPIPSPALGMDAADPNLGRADTTGVRSALQAEFAARDAAALPTAGPRNSWSGVAATDTGIGIGR